MSLSAFRWAVSESAEVGILTKLLPFLYENGSTRFSNPFLHYERENQVIYFSFEHMRCFFWTATIQPDLESVERIIISPRSMNEKKIHDFFWSHMAEMGFQV